MKATFSIAGQYVDIVGKQIYPASIQVENGIIVAISPCENAPFQYVHGCQ